MNDPMMNQYTEQLEKLFTAPARAYTKLAMAYVERMIEAQIDTVQSYSAIGIQQARAALDIKDSQSFQHYAESQQAVAQDLSNRFKADAEKVAAMNQDLVNETQKLMESNVNAASEAATETATAAKKAAKAG